MKEWISQLLFVSLKVYEDIDWFVVSNPTRNEEFPLLQNFLRVAPKPNTVLNQDLHLFHRAAHLRNIKVDFMEYKNKNKQKKG